MLICGEVSWLVVSRLVSACAKLDGYLLTSVDLS